MKKILALIMAISVLLGCNVCYAAGTSGIEVGRHTETDVINIEGQIAYSDIIPNVYVTVLVWDGGECAYIEDLTPDFLGKYSHKFYCDVSDDATIKIKYNGKDVSNTLTLAQINGKSTIMEAEIILLNERGSLFSQKEEMPMPVHDQFVTKVLNIKKDYQSMYANMFGTEGDKVAKAYIEVNNAYGLDESYTPIIACYGENNKLLSTKIYDVVEVNFEDKNKKTYTDTIDVPDGTVRVKAFAWDKEKLIPFGDSNEGELEPIQVFLIGSSAATQWMGTNTGAYPGEGYGLLFGDYFNSDLVTFVNNAVSGASTASFLDDKTGYGYWPKTRDAIKPGDYVIIELGGNDTKGTYYPGWEETGTIYGTFTEDYYKQYLMQMYNDVVERGGNVLFSSSSGPINGDPYTTDGGLRGAGRYGQVEVTSDPEKQFIIHPSEDRQMTSGYRKELADLTGTPYIDAVPEIYEMYNNALYERFDGDLDALRGYYLRDTRYMMLPEDEGGYGLDSEDAVLNSDNTGTTADNFYQDFSHTSLRGADEIAHLLYEEIMKSDTKLKFYMR